MITYISVRIAAAVAAAVQPILTATEQRILNPMAMTQTDLDNAIANVNTAVQKLGTDLQTAITALQAKAAGSGIDFTPEVSQLNSIATAAQGFDATAAGAES